MKKDEERSVEELEMEALIQVVELAHDYNLESDPAAEALYDKYVKDPRREEARERFRRKAYMGTAAEGCGDVPNTGKKEGKDGIKGD